MGKPATVSPPYQPVAFQFCARLEPKPCTSTMVGWLVSSDGDSRSKASATPSDAVVNWGITWLPSNLSGLSIRPNSQSPPPLSIKAGHEKISVPGRHQWRDRGGRGRPCVPCTQSALGARGHRPAGRHLSPGPCGGAGPGGSGRPRRGPPSRRGCRLAVPGGHDPVLRRSLSAGPDGCAYLCLSGTVRGPFFHRRLDRAGLGGPEAGGLIVRGHVVKRLALLMLMAATPAFAHAKLTASDPAADAKVKTPKMIRLTFSEKLEPAFSGASLIDAAGKTVPLASSVAGTGITLL